jgi:Domain of unknown function (DUF4129)
VGKLRHLSTTNSIGSLMRLSTCAVLLLALSSSAPAAPISLSEFRQQLRSISEKASSLDQQPELAKQLIADIPDAISVATSTGMVDINLRYFKDDLATLPAADANHRSPKLHEIQNYLSALEAEADTYGASGNNRSSSRQKLNTILSRREFKRVHEPRIQETLLSKIYSWLARLFRRFRMAPNATFNVLQVIVYVLLATVLLLLLLWTNNRLRRKEEELPAKEIIPFSPSARSWRSWLADARSFAAKQDWRNAIHLAYWAGIAFLESGGAWKPNRARTPREYLRLLSTGNPHYWPLSALTRKFEVVWYGRREVAEQDFQETLGQLEKLGCR